MFHTAYRNRLQARWVDELRLEYWRQVLRLTRGAGRLKRQLARWEAQFRPFRDLMWWPIVSGLLGVVLGLVFTTIIPMI